MRFVPNRHNMNSNYYVSLKMTKEQCRIKNCVHLENRARLDRVKKYFKEKALNSRVKRNSFM